MKGDEKPALKYNFICMWCLLFTVGL